MQPQDVIQKLNRSTIQHGLYNRRIYLMKLHPDDLPQIIPRMDALAQAQGYGKILAKIPGRHAALLTRVGYNLEGAIPKYFMNQDEAFFMSKYLSVRRKKALDSEYIREILSLTARRRHKPPKKLMGHQRSFQHCRPEDAREMSELFQAVFETYPFPVFDPGYLIESMRRQNHYFCIRRKGRMIAIAASEIDTQNRSAEMTDFATLSKHRGQGLAGYLLMEMEQAMAREGMQTLFSIARALSPAINITFGDAGYTFGGTLINNTNISGRIESMNIWYKQL